MKIFYSTSAGSFHEVHAPEDAVEVTEAERQALVAEQIKELRQIWWSKSTNGFYSRAIHADAIPSDAVRVSDEQHRQLLIAQGEGRRIAADAEGKPIAVDRPPPTPEEKARTLRTLRDRALASTDWLITRHHEEQSKQGIGKGKPAVNVTTLSAEQYSELLAYRTKLRDLTKAEGYPDVLPPAPPAFLAK